MSRPPREAGSWPSLTGRMTGAMARWLELRLGYRFVRSCVICGHSAEVRTTSSEELYDYARAWFDIHDHPLPEENED